MNQKHLLRRKEVHKLIVSCQLLSFERYAQRTQVALQMNLPVAELFPRHSVLHWRGI